MNAPVEKQAVAKVRIGEVVSAKMEKTIVVQVERRMPHPQYKKIIRLRKKLYAHDEEKRPSKGTPYALWSAAP
jgi:small subunit ribosomal protein S17